MKRFENGDRVAIIGLGASNLYFFESWARVVYVPRNPQEPYGVRLPSGHLVYRWVNPAAQDSPMVCLADLNKGRRKLPVEAPVVQEEVSFRHPDRFANWRLQIRGRAELLLGAFLRLIW